MSIEARVIHAKPGQGFVTVPDQLSQPLLTLTLLIFSFSDHVRPRPLI
jgi:hypothetical protein